MTSSSSLILAGRIQLGTFTSPHRNYYRCSSARPLSSFPSSSSKSDLHNGNLIISNSSPSQLYSSTPTPSVALATCKEEVNQEKCSLVLIGLNMETAPAMVREKLVFPREAYSCVIQHLLGLPSIKEAFVLSTPDLFQVHAVVQPTSLGLQQLTSWMSKRSGLNYAELKQHIFVHCDGKAARHLLEALVVDDFEVPRGSFSFFLLSTPILESNFGGVGVILSDLASKAFLHWNEPLSSTESICSAALAVAQAELHNMVPKCPISILVIGMNDTADELITKLFWYNHRRRNIVVVSHDYEFGEYRRKHISWRPMSELLFSASEANLIFITSPSHTPLFSKDVIDSLPPPSVYNNKDDDEKVCGGSGSGRIFVDMCHPPCMRSKMGVESARVFDIGDIFRAMDRRASKIRKDITGEVEDFESWMEGALGEDGVYAHESASDESLSYCLCRDALDRNLDRIHLLTKNDEARKEKDELLNRLY